MAKRLGTALLVAACGLTGIAGPAFAAKQPVYRDPPSYDGRDKAPKLAPAPLPPLPPPVTLHPSGTFPDVVVDEAGTAHIVFNDGRGDDSDAAVYCRLKRGASACDATTVLTWEKTYDTGDGPQFNTDDGGPEIVRVGAQLVVLSKRYPTGSEKPDGLSSHTLLAWTSVDGGTNWTPNPAIVGKRNLGDPLHFGPDDDPTIVNVAHDPFCGGMCVTSLRSGTYSADEGVLNTDPNSNYNPTLTLDSGVPLTGFSDLVPRIWLRRWSGTGAITNPGTWSQSPPIPGDEPSLAGGPAGTFLMHRPGYSGPYQVRPLSTQPDNTVTAGDPVAITGESGARFGRLEQDPSGRLLAAWSQDDGVQLRTSTAGAGGFGAAQRLIDGNANGQIELAATTDGGGFAVLNHTGGVNSPGQIVANGFGDQAATGIPGLGSIPGGSGPLATQTCQEARFGRIAITTASGCLLNGTGSKSHLIVSAGEVNLFGVRIVPDQDVRIIFDPQKLTIDTTGPVRVMVSNPGAGDVVLWHGEVHRDLSRVGPGVNLFDFPVSKFRANVFGFDAAGDVAVQVVGSGATAAQEGFKGVRIPLKLKLPKEFLGFTGDAMLRSSPDGGLKLESLKIEIGPIGLFGLELAGIKVEYKPAEDGDVWRGGGKIKVPAGGELEALFQFHDGSFAGAEFDYEINPAIPVGPFIYLASVAGGLFFEPDVELLAGVGFAMGAKIADEAPVKADGELTFTFPREGPAEFAAEVEFEIFTIKVGKGEVKFKTDGNVTFGGDTFLGLGPLGGHAELRGFVDASNGRFGADLVGQLKFCLLSGACTGPGLKATVSDIGFAACGVVEVLGEEFTAGLGTRWDEINPLVLYQPVIVAAEIIDSILIPCDTGPFRVPPPQAAQAGAHTVTIPKGLPTATIRVRGAGARPDVTVTGPNGEVVSATPSDAGLVTSVDGVDAVWALVRKPAAGTWTVTAQPGSPSITEVLISSGYERAKPRADVRRGRIAYRIANLGGGQRVTFAETGRFGTNILKTVKKPRGTFRFKPGSGAGGRRDVIAFVERSDGVAAERVKVGSYVAPPPPRPTKPRKVRARRKGRVLTVTWKPPRRAANTIVRVRSRRGAELAAYVGGRKRKARFAGVRWAKGLKVEVVGISKHNRRGKPARARARGR